MSQKTSQSQSSLLSVQNVILASIIWGLLALFIFLLGSPITPRPVWYNRATYILENTAFFAATLLCLRNWRSSKIVSGRTVWLLIGIGMLCYFTANLLFGWWESALGVAPDVSPADFLYLLSYLLLGFGMLLAVLSKQLNLSTPQWIAIASIALLGILLAYFVSGYAGRDDEATWPTELQYRSLTPHLALVKPAAADDRTGWIAQAEAPSLETTPETPVDAPALPETDSTIPADQLDSQNTPASESSIEDSAAPANVPTWMANINEQLEPLADIVWILYLAGDTFLVVMATTLLLAFWGGRFSMSWRFIAAAGFSFYIADMWYYYAIDHIENYETGALPEIFWIFSGVLFCIGAALEYNLSTRSRRGRRRSV